MHTRYRLLHTGNDVDLPMRQEQTVFATFADVVDLFAQNLFTQGPEYNFIADHVRRRAVDAERVGQGRWLRGKHRPHRPVWASALNLVHIESHTSTAISAARRLPSFWPWLRQQCDCGTLRISPDIAGRLQLRPGSASTDPALRIGSSFMTNFSLSSVSREARFMSSIARWQKLQL